MPDKLIATSDWRRTPTAEHRFFLYDPEGDGMMFFRDAATRDAIANVQIGEYCDDYWSDEVTSVCAGEVTARAVKTNVQQRPKREEFDSDEEYEDADEEWPSEHDETCNYELKPLANQS